MKIKEPKFIGIGGHRCATTWLFTNLININKLECGEKETHFFSRHYDYGFDWYYQQIYKKKSSDRMNFCEFSTSYLYSYHAPTRVKINFPNTKILVVLRNPILRTLSHLRHEVLNGRSNFQDIKNSIKNNPSLIDLSLYYDHLKRWIDAHSEEQIKIIIFEEMVANPFQEINSIQSFLGLSQVSKSKLELNKINKSLYPTSAKNFKLYQNLKNFYFNTPVIKKLLPSGLSSILKSKIMKNLFEEKKSNYEIDNIKNIFFEKNLIKDIDNLSNLINKDLKKIWDL